MITLARLFGTLLHLDDSSTGPPWPMQIWNSATGVWESIGPAARAASKAIRMRTAGGELDIDAGGASLYLSTFEADDFVTQHFGLHISQFGAGVTLHQHALPETDDALDLGASAQRWRRLYVQSIDLAGTLVTGLDGANANPSSLLVLTPNPYNFVDDSTTENGQPVDFITTAHGDVISVGGM